MDLQAVKNRLEQRDREQQQQLERHRIELIHRLEKGVPDFMHQFPNVQKLVAFGSIVRPDYLSVHSDIDLAVAGLRNDQYWQAIGWFESCLRTERIDLVRIEDASPGILEAIHCGKVLYDATG